jgi:hypothetical protein
MGKPVSDDLQTTLHGPSERALAAFRSTVLAILTERDPTKVWLAAGRPEEGIRTDWSAETGSAQTARRVAGPHGVDAIRQRPAA